MLRQFAGPVMTFIVALLIHILSPYISISFGLAFVAIVWTAYVSGPIPTIASSAIVLAFMGLSYPPDYGRFIQSGVSAVAIGIMVIILKRRAAMTETLNGNVNRLREALNITRSLLREWDDFSENGRIKQLRLIEDKLGNLAALVYGWHKIHQEMEQTKAEIENDSVRQSSE